MKRHIRIAILAFWAGSVWFAQNAEAQEGCNNCNLDSVTGTLKTAKSDEEKIRILSLLIDLRLIHINIHGVNENILTDDSTTDYIRSLIALSQKLPVNDIDGYKSILSAYEFFDKKDFLQGQLSLKNAIALFDKSHKKIPRLLFNTRLSFNIVGNQEDRLNYYTEKLRYYLTYGPVENVAPCYHALGGYYLVKADYNLAISNYLKAASLFKNFDFMVYRNELGVAADAYVNWGNYGKAMTYFNIIIPMDKRGKDSFYLTYSYLGLAHMHTKLGQYKEAMLFADTLLVYSNNKFPDYDGNAYLIKAQALISMNRMQEALRDLDYARKMSDSSHVLVYSAHGSFELDYGYAQYYAALKNYDQEGNCLQLAYEKAVQVKSNQLQLKYLRSLGLFYGQQHNVALSHGYMQKFFDLTDELDQQQSSFKVAQFENEQRELGQNDSINLLRQREAVQAATIKKNNTILWGAFVAILLISCSLFFVYRQYRINKRTLLSLRRTQRQLINAEKMASLGELTAGIAHEIQNPLNFVNNFSEVNTELIEEAEQAIDQGKSQEAKELLASLKNNQFKINQHGQRADAIVKGMLQHSRNSSGQKELTDINKLADEYLDLGYHGLRAKDKEFNAAIKKDFDPQMEKVNIIAQDIGRVLLNLYNNAFYAVTEKKKQNLAGYDPTVSIITKMNVDGVEIRIKDNGNGIPQKVIDKIFQPFFTTKPSGQGTGLGLSLSYDMVKAHGGEISVETKDGEWTEFTLTLPV